MLKSEEGHGVQEMNQLGVSALVKGIRESTGWTQEKLAQGLGVAFSTVNGLERGRRSPHPYLMQKLLGPAECMNVTAEGFYLGPTRREVIAGMDA